MNILVYWEQYSWGGTDTHLLNWAKGQDKLFGHEDKMFILTNDLNSGFFRIEKDLNDLKSVHSIHFKLFSAYSIRQKVNAKIQSRISRKFISLAFVACAPMFLFIQYMQLFLQIENLQNNYGQMDSAVSNNGAYPGAWGNLMFIAAAKLAGCKKTVMLVHHHATRAKGIKKNISNIVDFIGLKWPDAVVAVSEATKSTIIKNRGFSDAKKIEVIFNGLDFEYLSSRINQSKLDLHERFKISKTKKLVGILGVQEEYKGHDDLIKAFGLLKKKSQLNDLFLMIIGKEDPVEKKRLEKTIAEAGVQDSILFTGYVKESSYDIIQSLDLLVVATKDFEGFGLTLGEAMAVGTPILATHVGAIPEFVFHNENGYLVPPNNPEKMAEALNDLNYSKAAWFERAEKAKETIREFSLENMAHNFHQSFKQTSPHGS